MLLLEEQWRAIPDAASVKQNVPTKVLDEFRKISSNYSRMFSILNGSVWSVKGPLSS